MRYTEVYNNTKVDPGIASILAAMPKAEIHVHLEGALSPELIHRLSKRNHVSLPADTPEEWQRCVMRLQTRRAAPNGREACSEDAWSFESSALHRLERNDAAML